MTRKSNRVNSRRNRTRTLAEVLEEEAQQQQQQQQQQHCPDHRVVAPATNDDYGRHSRHHHRQQVLVLEQLQNEIQLHQQNVVQRHEVEMNELEMHLRMQPEIGEALLRSLGQLQQLTDRRQDGDTQALEQCETLLQKVTDMQELGRRTAAVDPEEPTFLRETRKRVESQAMLLLGCIRQMCSQYFSMVLEYLDRLSHRILLYASSSSSTNGQQNQEFQDSVRSILLDPEQHNNLLRYNTTHCMGEQYRWSRGKVSIKLTPHVVSPQKVMLECTEMNFVHQKSTGTHHPDKDDNNNEQKKKSLSMTRSVSIDYGNGDVVTHIDDETLCCIICLMEYQDGEEVYRNATKEVVFVEPTLETQQVLATAAAAVVPVCNHFFHTRCISQWLHPIPKYYRATTASCPCCRNQFLIKT